MKKDLCELLVVIDESGSMGEVTNDTIGGFNTFLETHQSLPGEAKLTLVKFDTKYEIVHNGINVKDAPKLNKTTYRPGGSTALLDAVGRTIDEVGRRLADTLEDDRPERVILLIMTDGEENSSSEYNLDQIKQKIEHQKTVYNWEVIFMGADQDAWSNARGMGISNSVNFSKFDTRKTLKGMAHYTANYRMKSANTSMDSYLLSESELDKDLENMKDQKPKDEQKNS